MPNLTLPQIIENHKPGFSSTKNTTEKGKVFLKWFFENVENDIFTEKEDVDSCLVGGSGDCGIDAYYYNEENKVLRLYQGKFKNNGTDLTEPEKNAWKNLINSLKSHELKAQWANTNINTLDKVLYYSQSLLNLYTHTVNLDT